MWVGESSFWYRPTRVVPDQRPLNGRSMGDFIFWCTKNHPLVFSNSKLMFTWHICYTSNSACSQFTVQSMITLKIRRPIPRYYRNKCPRSHGITVNLVPVPAVLPWSWSPSSRCYHELCPHYHGVTTVTAGKPWSPSPCSSLVRTVSACLGAEIC